MHERDGTHSEIPFGLKRMLRQFQPVRLKSSSGTIPRPVTETLLKQGPVRRPDYHSRKGSESSSKKSKKLDHAWRAYRIAARNRHNNTKMHNEKQKRLRNDLMVQTTENQKHKSMQQNVDLRVTSSYTKCTKSLRDFQCKSLSETFRLALNADAFVYVNDTKSPYFWRNFENPSFRNRRAAGKLNFRDAKHQLAWYAGLIKVRDVRLTDIPYEMRKYFVEIAPKELAVAQLPYIWHVKALTSVLVRARAKILNIFGSLRSSKKRGDPVIHAIIANGIYNSVCPHIA
jgi:hypothetical protein